MLSPKTPRANTNATRRTLQILAVSVGIIGLSSCFVRGDGPSGGGGDAYLDTYERCDSDFDCYDECWVITVEYVDGYVTDAMCTYPCDYDDDCDYGGYCLAISDEPPLCYQPCLDDYDCPVGFACVADEFGYDPVCLPW